VEHIRIDGHLFAEMIFAGAQNLKKNAKRVDDLNVFPVPDGDTGTNMTLSFTSGANELRKNLSEHLGKAVQALSKGLLMGARGNSGVILSQLFRGFGKAVSDKAYVDAIGFAEALQEGVETAYKAVMKPVEGTILTVSKEAAKAGLIKAKRENNITLVMNEVLKAAKEALERTPQQLPILRQVGVVDAGGQGLVYVYEGFLSVLRGETKTEDEIVAANLHTLDDLADAAHDQLPAQANMRPEEIEFGYCTEFIINLDKTYKGKFDEKEFREQMSKFGDSLLVISDEELVKVHIHAEYPGDVLSFAQKYGHFKKIKIENMREQLQTILDEEVHKESVTSQAQEINKSQSREKAPIGILAVAAGEGLEEIFKSLGVDALIHGGQTMNPSTEDIVKAIAEANAESILILPNNGNIIMAAEQAKELVDIPVEVVPTKTIPQGIAACIAFDPTQDLKTNAEQMGRAAKQVTTGLITHAVRDSKFGDLEIKEGDYLGIKEKDIVAAEQDLNLVCTKLIQNLINDETSVVTIIYGEEASPEMTDQLTEFISSNYPDIEVEVHYGGQPVYTYIFSIE
jgi:DAK2 domain fusion protein YloV